MIRLPPKLTRTSPPFPYTPLFRSSLLHCLASADRCDLPGLDTSVLPERTLDPHQAVDRPNPYRVRDRHRGHLGRDAMVCGAARLSIAAWTRLVHGWGHARLSAVVRSEEHTSELQSLMRISYAVFCLKKKKK